MNHDFKDFTDSEEISEAHQLEGAIPALRCN